MRTRIDFGHRLGPRRYVSFRNIMAHELLFRINIACDLIYGAGLVVLLTALYVILKPVNRSHALLAAFFRLFRKRRPAKRGNNRPGERVLST